MESSSSDYYNKDNEEESLLANVASLRHELKITEWSLQSLGEELSSVSPSENSDYAPNPSRSEKLILDVQPSHPGLLNYSPYENVCKISGSSTDFQKKPRDKMFSSSTPVDQEIKSLREKLNKLRQQNACLVTQNHSLMTKFESIHFELTQSRAKVSMLESAQQQAASVPILEEQIINLEAEVSAQDKVLREAENKLEQSQKMVIEKEQSLQKSKEECIKLKVDLLEQTKQGKRAERQRNEALYNAEELSKAFQQYKKKVAEKLEKVQAEEEILERNLINCEKENKRLQEKCGLYKSELEILKEKLRQLKEENNNGKEKLRIMAVKNSEVMAQLTESRQSILKLESELENKDEILRDKFSLMNENRELKVRVAAQNERLDLCQQEIQSSRVELRSLEKIISQLPEKNEKIRSLETNINTEHEKICLAFEKAKKIHLEQHKEMEKQIERLEVQLEKKDQQFKEQEKTMSMLQQDIICKQHHLESLDRLLTESKGEMEKENMKKDEALKALQNQVSEETIKVRQLDSALEICKEELVLHLNQLEGNKEKFEKQLKKKSEEVYCLQKELKIKNHSLQETSEQNVILQHTLQQQQQMLQQETIRNGELEDTQTKLEKQVSKLEQELQKQRESSAEKLRKMEEKCESAAHEADLKRQKVIELTGTARQVKVEMDQYKEELSKMEKEIMHLKRDGENKAMHLSQLDMMLDQTKTELEKKTNAVKELEKLQHRTETELTEALQKREVLETELQNAHGELKSTLRQLQELRDVLQKAQLSLEEKYTTIKDLTAELRECKMEIEDKKQELLEMDQALKERNWELKQRAAQVTHLDMTIREHRGEMEQKIIKLEGTLEKSELELKECNKQIESLNDKLQNAKEQLREKEFIVLQNEQEISQLKKEIERTQQRMKEMESVMKEQEQYIATQYKEAIDLGQELRLTREQVQNSHTELAEARRQQVQAQREIERLSSELEDIKQLSKEKDAHGNHLAEELGASKVREAHLEARMQAEIKKLSAEVESLKEAYHMEMISHQENHAKWKISADSQKTSVQQLNEQLEKAKLELEEAQDTVSNLHQQVQDRNEVIEAANEALLTKESELTRLQAKISGHEKAEDMKFLPAPFTSPTEIMPDVQDSKFAKRFHTSFSKCTKLRRSISASDLTFKTNGDEDLSEELLQDLKKMQLEQPSTLEESHKNLTYTQPDSFKPLTYNLEDESSESNDFNTLSGMLRYINKEVRLLKKSSMQTGAGLNQGENV
ncbi:coiled-coil domain-containing protein 18 isoform X14 [Pongo pygmaeus]|uniref:coiled-coil domain-containing protein 18 isoform X14 n=1 Tax=Pongo pygmaeus TaxID=9600 RepID=UPI00300D4F52